MAEHRKLLLASTWALEDRGVEELRTIICTRFPRGCFDVGYEEANHTLSITGQFERDDEVKIALLMANFIKKYDQPGTSEIPQIPRVRQLRTISSLEISAKHHNPKALLEESHDQKTADERYFEDWIPSRAGLPPLTRSSLSLLPSVARTSNTLISQVSVGDELGLRISALNKEGIRMAIENLEVLGPCFNSIASLPRGLLVYAPEHEREIFKIMKYSSISALAHSRFLSDSSQSRPPPPRLGLVACRFDSVVKKSKPLLNIFDPPSIVQKLGVVTSRDWRGIKAPAIGTGHLYFPSSIDRHAPKSANDTESLDTSYPCLNPFKADEVDHRHSRDSSTKESLIDLNFDQPISNKPPASSPDTRALSDQENIRPLSQKPEGIKTRLAVLPSGEVLKRDPKPTSIVPIQASNPTKPAAREIPDHTGYSTSFLARSVIEPSGQTPSPHVPSLKAPGTARAASSSSYPNTALGDTGSAGDHSSKNLKWTAKTPTKTQDLTDLPFDLGPKDESSSLRVEDLKSRIRTTCATPTKARVRLPPMSAIPGKSKVAPIFSGSLIDFDAPLENPKSGVVQYEKKRYTSDELLALRPKNANPKLQEPSPRQLQGLLSRDEVRPQYWLRSATAHGKGVLSSPSRPAFAASPQKKKSIEDMLKRNLLAVIAKEGKPTKRAMSLLSGISQQTNVDDPATPAALDISPADASANAIESEPTFLQGQNDVPSVHPDLIDLSFENETSPMPNTVVQPYQNVYGQPTVFDELATTEEPQTREFHETMFHQKPSQDVVHSLDGAGGENKPTAKRELQDSKDVSLGQSMVKVGATSEELPDLSLLQLSTVRTKLAAEREALSKATQSIFHSMAPHLEAAREFPGQLFVEIQIGLVSILNLTASSQGKEMTYKEIHDIFFSEHNLKPPRTSFTDRLTSSPSDIDYLLGLEVDGESVFDHKVGQRGIKYNFRCRTGSNVTFFISLDYQGNATYRYPRVSLGSVPISFPTHVWDASATIKGFTLFDLSSEKDLKQATKAMIKSLWVDPTQDGFEMLLRLPPKSILKVDAITVERRTTHRWNSEQSKNIFLQVAEHQALKITPSVLDPNILVAKSAPHEDMVKQGRYWWRASIISPAIENILKARGKNAAESDTLNGQFDAADLFGEDYKFINPSADLSPIGTELGHSGIGAMFRLAKTVIEKIDGIGYFNNAHKATTVKRNADPESGKARDQDWKKTALVKWNPKPATEQQKNKW